MKKLGLLVVILLSVGLGVLVTKSCTPDPTTLSEERARESPSTTTDPAQPSEERIREDLGAIAEATRATADSTPDGSYRGDSVTGPLLELEGLRIEGISLEGKIATVLVVASVKYTEEIFRDTEGRVYRDAYVNGGFARWARRDFRSYSGDSRSKTEGRPGDFRFYRVTMVYRLYDTGWRLEEYK